ncbi:helix-turn-helix domain-containing protein [Paenibacillus thalictri]|nr:helix-turn-helix domain-containing protein [Paenibacillus thalictri]
MWRNRYFLKLIALVMLIGSVPVLVLGYFAYSKSTASALEKSELSNMNLLQQFQLRIEEKLAVSEKLANHLASSILTTEAMRMSLDERDFEIIQQLEQGIKYVQFAQSDIKEANLISLYKNWRIGTYGTIGSHYAVEYSEMFRDVLDDRRTAFWSIRPTSSSTLLQYVVKIPQYAEQPSGLLTLSLSLDALGSDMMQHAGRLLIVDGMGQVVHDSWGKRTGEAGDPSLLESIRAHAEDSGHLAYRDGSEDQLVFYRKSTNRDWLFVAEVPKEAIISDSLSIGRITLVLIVIVLAVIAIGAYAGSRNLYQPIYRLYASLIKREEPEREATSRDEFQVMYDSVDDLLHSRRQWRLQLPQLKQFFILKLLKGEAAEKEIAEKIDYFGFNAHESVFCTLSVEIDELDETRYEGKDFDLLLFACHNVIEELIPKDMQIGSVLTNSSIVTILCRTAVPFDEMGKLADGYASLIQSEIRRWLNLPVSIGISLPFDQLQEAVRSFHESQQALTYRLKLGSEAIIDYRDIDRSSRGQLLYPQYLEQRLLEAIKSADRHEAQERLHLFLKQIFAEYRSSTEYELIMARLVSSVIRCFVESGGSLDISGQSQPWLERLYRLHSRKEVEELLFQSMIEPMIEQLEKVNERRFQSISGCVLRLIQERLETDITLETCAELLNYHPTYLGRVFKRETGKSFSEHLAECRLQTARKWLLETEMTLAEIAGKLHYHDASNFSRSFKKTVGMNPGKYRQLYR